MRKIIMLVGVLAAGSASAATNEDVAYADGVNRVMRCADSARRSGSIDGESENYFLCLYAVAENNRLDPLRLANKVIRSEGRNVFEGTAGSALSSKAIARINAQE